MSLGSSFAAGPGIAPRATDRPRKAGQSRRNYPHRLAELLDLDLVDATSKGATVADVMTRSQFGQPPQIEAVTASTKLVTLTVGGNDLGYTASLYAACIPPWVSRVPGIADRLRLATEPSRNADRRADATDALVHLLGDVRRRAPQAVIMCIDYLTVLPATFRDDLPLNAAQHQRILALADDLNGALAAAARHQGVELVSASQHSVEHHAWSADPWTTGWSNPIRWRASAFHPNGSGMAQISAMVYETITQGIAR